jgi:hypothetical protein
VEARTALGGATPGVGWCDRATGIRIAVTGPSARVSEIAADLQIRAAPHVPTKGPAIPFHAGQATPDELARMPDFIPVTGRGTIAVAGYASKCDLGFCPGVLPELSNAPIDVYGPDLRTLVGHEYPGKGFVPLGTNPDTIPRVPVTCISDGKRVPC